MIVSNNDKGSKKRHQGSLNVRFLHLLHTQISDQFPVNKIIKLGLLKHTNESRQDISLQMTPLPRNNLYIPSGLWGFHICSKQVMLSISNLVKHLIGLVKAGRGVCTFMTHVGPSP